VILSGDPTQLNALLKKIGPPWKIDARGVHHALAFARIESDINVPYREVGSLIITAQERGLAAKFYTSPPICGLNGDAEK